MSTPTYLALVWHMHQPSYKDQVTGRYELPWVRLHGTKDYYDMVRVLADYPKVHATFNLVPSLLAQIEDYAAGTARDAYIDLTVPAPENLAPEDRASLLLRFFDAHAHHMIAPHARYAELLERRGDVTSGEDVARAASRFDNQDLLDLQVWFNLAWCDPLFQRSDPVIRKLVEKGSGFNAEDKEALLQRQQEILGMIIPAYRDAQDRGQIEITTTPFYHPILPLLCDTQVASEALPHHPLPRRFQHPEDAAEQIRRGVAYHRKMFGRAPRGMWPSEGSVSEAMIPLAVAEGIQWIASDEAVLRESLRMAPSTASDLYRPYRLDRDGGSLSILFRDHGLSDRVGFTYSGWDPEDAAANFVHLVREAGQRARATGSPERPPLVPVILDGENCWEYYPDDGHPFLNALYRQLEEADDIVCTTVSDYLDHAPATDDLPRLFAGSWINRDFEIWIGREEDNAAWELVHDARDALVARTREGAKPKLDKDDVARAWECLYAAEGSDWCWWYGGQHQGMLGAFDTLFRRHVANVYHLIGEPVPEAVRTPVLQYRSAVTATRPEMGMICPPVHGGKAGFFDWAGAAMVDAHAAGGGSAMHAGGAPLRRLFYGFDPDHLFLRLELTPGSDGCIPARTYVVRFLAPTLRRLVVEAAGDGCHVSWHPGDPTDDSAPLPFAGRAEIGSALDLAFPVAPVGWHPEDVVQLYVQVFEGHVEVARWPAQGWLEATVPTATADVGNWLV